jgi:Holliday junction resolvase RusA-like endonuclease
MGTGVVEFTVVGDPHPQPRVRARVAPGRPPRAQMYYARTEVDPKTKKRRTAGWVVWKDVVTSEAKRLRLDLIEGPVCVDLLFRFRRPAAHFRIRQGRVDRSLLKPDMPEWYAWPKNRADRDNLDKLVLDALTDAGVWKGDGLVCDGRIRKPYANPGEAPGVDIRIELL